MASDIATAEPAGPGFAARASIALRDDGLRRKFRRAMDGLMTKRAAQFPDADAWNSLRARGSAIRRRSLARLPELLEQLDARCRANGIQVHWAETSADADRIIQGILTDHGVRTVIKGKSMVSEEIHLNDFLAQHQISAVESDLGEFVIQLAHETPSHIIMPCIHKSREDVAALFHDHIAGQPYTDDVDALTATARRVLREQFASADAGLSGVNFAVAETGTLCLVENEGNGRLSTTLPPLHIAVMGLEKVVERLEDVPPLLTLLTRSATGQPITTYVNFISSPRREGEQDGPREVHLVLLDNGRTRIFGDLQLRETLACIRCGACMNHCPVYTRVGGHAYDAVYPGPIGKILTPQINGIEAAGDLPHASSLCGACGEVCPVSIPIPNLLVRLRSEAAHRNPASTVKGHGTRHSYLEDLTWRGWRLMYGMPLFYRVGTRLLTLFGNALPASLPGLRNWTSVRTKPQFARQPLNVLVRARGSKMSDVKAAILARLRTARPVPVPPLPDWSVTVPEAERLKSFCDRLEASHAEVLTSTSADWPTLLADRLKARGNERGAAGGSTKVLFAPSTGYGQQLGDAWAGQTDLHLVAYDQPVESLKDELVHGVDAAVTDTRGGIAETGTLILWPSSAEPRLMSLLPPLHVALVKADQIFGTLTEAMTAQNWSAGMPTNALLISGPSKTADIEQTLAYGVHGPKELMVIVLDS